MSALKQVVPSEVLSVPKGARKPAVRADSLHWKVYKTNYQTGSGYSPAWHEAVRHKPRLCGESAVMRDLVEYCNMRSYGRPRGKKDARHVWTDLLTTEELAEHCLCRVREIQRQISEMEARGMIAVRRLKGGLEISLLYTAWPEIEDYAVWKRKQVVTPIDEGEGYTEDEPAPEVTVSKEAVPLFKRPTSVRPGRASRAVPITVGIKEFVFVNRSSSSDIICEGVIESGRLTLFTDFRTPSIIIEGRTKGEKVARNDADFRVTPSTAANPTEKIRSGKSPSLDFPPLPGGDIITAVFDPHLSRKISIDFQSLQKACNELQDLPASYLEGYARDRVTRGIKGPSVVWHIVRDARLNWEKSGRPDVFDVKGPRVSKADAKKEALLKRMRDDRERAKSWPKMN